MAQGAWDTGTWDAALWDSLPVTGNSATGSPGSVGTTVTVALSGNSASGQVGDIAFVPQPILLIDDTHDGRRFKEQLERDKKLRKKQKQQILDAFERIVEGRPEIAEEIAAPYVVKKSKTKAAPIGPTINFDALFADLDRVQRIWNTHLEMDDEDVLTLL